jgi:transposase
MTARQHPAQADIAQIAPFADAAARLNEIPGVGLFAAHTIIAGIGLDMNRFPAAGHPCSWAKPPSWRNPPARRRAGTPLATATATWPGAGRSSRGRQQDTFLGERYRRIARCRGNKKAVVAVSRSILAIVWHLLSDPAARLCDLGPGFYDTRIQPDRKKRNHARQLEALGHRVALEPTS